MTEIERAGDEDSTEVDSGHIPDRLRGDTSLVGTTIHTIRLIELVGSGGMGEVYLGFDERLQRKVAVKALRGDRRMDERARSRVLKEARVLSLLEHPNICRLYELIEGDDGDFLVMELVPGRSLHRAIEEGLSPSQKLDIARQVTTALVTAHGLSVIHRDLKPENVMLTPDGVVRVLDFGLARSVAEEVEPIEPGRFPTVIGEGATLTAFGTILGTPRYMSPEQARGEPANAASDMYSLGLLLQELFTGKPPVVAGMPLSVMLQRAMWGESEPVRGLPSSLSALIEQLKALQPFERPSAQAVAEALRRIADAPRRRVRVAIAIALAATLVVASVVSSVGFVRARKALRQAEVAEQDARSAQRQAEEVNRFLQGMLASADPRGMGIGVKVVDVLDSAATSADALSHEPLVEAGVRETLGKTYLALGQFPKAREHLERALALRSEGLGEQAPETLRVQAVMGRVLHAEGAEKEAESLLREVMRRQVRLHGIAHPDFLDTQLDWAQVRQSQREHEDVARAMQRALPHWRRIRGADYPDTLAAQHLLGNAFVEWGKFDQAEPVLQDCLERRKRVLGEVHPDTAATINVLAASLTYRKRFEEAEVLQRRCVEISEAVYGPEHPKALQARSNLNWVVGNQGRHAELEQLTRSLGEVQKRVLGEGHPSTLGTTRQLAFAVFAQGRHAEALSLLRQRVEAARRVLGEEHRSTLEAQSHLSFMLRNTGRPREAEQVLRHVLDVRERVFGRDHTFAQRARRNLAAALRQQGRIKEAEALEASVSPSLIEEGFRGDIYQGTTPPVRPGAGSQ